MNETLIRHELLSTLISKMSHKMLHVLSVDHYFNYSNIRIVIINFFGVYICVYAVVCDCVCAGACYYGEQGQP